MKIKVTPFEKTKYVTTVHLVLPRMGLFEKWVILPRGATPKNLFLPSYVIML
jgi:hypothetical protein